MRCSTGVSAVCGLGAAGTAGADGAAVAEDFSGAMAEEACPEPLCAAEGLESAAGAAVAAGAWGVVAAGGLAGTGTGVEVAVCAKPSRIASAANPTPRPIRVHPSTVDILNGRIVLPPADQLRIHTHWRKKLANKSFLLHPCAIAQLGVFAPVEQGFVKLVAQANVETFVGKVLTGQILILEAEDVVTTGQPKVFL